MEFKMFQSSVISTFIPAFWFNITNKPCISSSHVNKHLSVQFVYIFNFGDKTTPVRLVSVCVPQKGYFYHFTQTYIFRNILANMRKFQRITVFANCSPCAIIITRVLMPYYYANRIKNFCNLHPEYIQVKRLQWFYKWFDTACILYFYSNEGESDSFKTAYSRITTSVNVIIQLSLGLYTGLR